MPEIQRIKRPEVLWKWLRYTGLPRSTRESIARTIRNVRSPGERAVRRSMVTSLESAKTPEQSFLTSQGYIQLPPDFAPGTVKIAFVLNQIYQSARGIVPGTSSGSKKTNFLVTVLQNEAFIAQPEILAYITSAPILELAAGYLGEAPVLSSVKLWWSPVNNTTQSSQLYHFDEEDDWQLKFFLNVSPVTSESGPFTLLPIPASEEVAHRAGRRHGRFPDELVERHVGPPKPVCLTGPSGTLAAVDTSRCLHFGSRGNTVDRVVLMFQFTRFSAPQARSPSWGPQIQPLVKNMSALQRRAFQYA